MDPLVPKHVRVVVVRSPAVPVAEVGNVAALSNGAAAPCFPRVRVTAPMLSTANKSHVALANLLVALPLLARLRWSGETVQQAAPGCRKARTLALSLSSASLRAGVLSCCLCGEPSLWVVILLSVAQSIISKISVRAAIAQSIFFEVLY